MATGLFPKILIHKHNLLHLDRGMKKLILLCLIAFYHTVASAQTNFITAGQTDNMIYTCYQPGSWALSAGDGQGGSGQNIMPVDLNGDGTVDFSILLDYQHIGVGSYSWTMTLVLSSNCYVHCQSDTYLVAAIRPSCLRDSTYYSVAENYLRADTLTDFSDTLWKTGNVLVEHYYNYTCDVYLQDTSKLSPAGEYHFFKLVINNDTLLAYARFSDAIGQNNEAGVTILLFDFACQGNQKYTTLPTAIAEITGAQNIKIYPVPFTQNLNIQSSQPITYTFFSNTGSQVLSGAGNRIDTEHLAPGAYMLVLKTGDTVFRKSVVKMR